MCKDEYKPLLSLDFDGVIHRYDSGWLGINIILDPPVDGAMKFISEASLIFEVHVFSSRSREPSGIEAMKHFILFYLKEYFRSRAKAREVFEKLKFPTTKPPAFLTIDDRCLQFTGEFMHPKTLLDFKPWNNVDISSPEKIAKEAKENKWKP